ncbi:MAG: M23 family metallopeptidase [Flavobacteriales bacterium AspAUS03]
MSSKFSYRRHPIQWKYKFHNGIDLPSRYGTPVYVTAFGVMKTVFYDREGVIYIEVDHLNGFCTLYVHLKWVIMWKGQ